MGYLFYELNIVLCNDFLIVMECCKVGIRDLCLLNWDILFVVVLILWKVLVFDLSECYLNVVVFVEDFCWYFVNCFLWYVVDCFLFEWGRKFVKWNLWVVFNGLIVVVVVVLFVFVVGMSGKYCLMV